MIFFCFFLFLFFWLLLRISLQTPGEKKRLGFIRRNHVNRDRIDYVTYVVLSSRRKSASGDWLILDIRHPVNREGHIKHVTKALVKVRFPGHVTHLSIFEEGWPKKKKKKNPKEIILTGEDKGTNSAARKKKKIWNRVDCQCYEKRCKTYKRLKERFLIGRNRTKRANFRGGPLFQATCNINQPPSI